MENLNNTGKENPENDYNAIPVHYCKNCLSLKIMILDESTDYCDDCGCTETGSTDINTWEEMYRKKYGQSY